MLLLLLLHLAAALVGPVLVRWRGRRMFAALALAPLSAVAWALSHTREVLDGDGPTVSTTWIAGLDIDLSFRLDTLSWFMVILVGGVGALVLLYCAWYFAAGASNKPRFAGVFVAFAGAMLGLVTTDSTLLLYIFWELTTVFSYLLIGHYNERKVSRRAAMQAIIVTTAGGLAMLGGIVVLGEAEGGSYSISALVANPPEPSVAVQVAVVALLVGALSKSAIFPFHFWLPGAMAAPTPVSAYLHAAAMVKAGIYLVARFAPAFAEWDVWMWPVFVLGAVTMLLGGYRALRQNDIKLLLAYGTVSQLGLLVMLVGQPDQGVALAGLAMVGAHAMFKASLFLVVGIVDAAAGTRDLQQLSNLRTTMPFLAVVAALGVASMIGLFPMSGYVAKEAALEGLLHVTGPTAQPMLAVVVVGSMLTVAYSLRFWWGAFGKKPGLEDTNIDHEPWPMFVAPTILAVLALATGLVPALGEGLLIGHAETYPGGEPGHLTLWAGFGLPLYLTVAVLAVGIAAFVWRAPIERAMATVRPALDVEAAYHRSMRGLDRVAAFTTSQTQRGSLPFYLSVILVVAVVGGLGTTIAADRPLGPVRLWDTPVQLVVAVIVGAAAILAARSRRRLKAVLLLGISGYGVAVIYELQGAPDLALTQVLVETVTLVVFVLVLRRLPPYFSNRPLAADRWFRMLLGAAVGTTVALLALLTTNARIHEPVSVNFPEEAYTYGYGKNIVNVTLVDIRAWDTMGEISVLLVAATGVASLVFMRLKTTRPVRARDIDTSRIGAVWAVGTAGDRRHAWLARNAAATGPASSLAGHAAEAGATDREHARRASRSDPTGPLAMRNRRWLPAGATLAPQRRSVIFEIAARLLFHVMVAFSIFLLFSGHNAPGGGFAGGLVAGIALVVRYLAGGRYELTEALPINAGLLLGSGLFLSAGAGLVPLAFGGTVLQSTDFYLNAGPLGEIHFVTTVFFDIGVYLVVVGLVLDMLRTLGAELDRLSEEAGTSTPEAGFADDDDVDEPSTSALAAPVPSRPGDGTSRGGGSS